MSLLFWPIQRLPLRVVCRLGRVMGDLAYRIVWRRKRIAMQNLRQCLGSHFSENQIRQICRENFKRIGENFISMVKLASMSWPEVSMHLRFVGLEKLFVAAPTDLNQLRGKFVFAIGHFGNFELFAWFQKLVPGMRCVTTYRGLNQAFFSDIMQSLRAQTGCTFIERRSEWENLRHLLGESENIIVGILADQHAGKHGLAIPFFGRNASTTRAPAVIARRYNCRLFTAFCFREGLAKWRIECGEEIPVHNSEGRPREVREIMADVNAAFERAILRDPANWFWVHNRWKSPGHS